MAAQPQPPQQPIYPTDLANAIDRTYGRTVTLIDARIDGLATQMRVDKLEMIERDNAIAQASMQRDQDLANTLLAFREESKKQIELLREESRRQNEGMLQLIRDLHAEAMESINKLRQAVNELKEKGNE